MTLTLLFLLVVVSGGNLALGFVAGRYLGVGSPNSPSPPAAPTAPPAE